MKKGKVVNLFESRINPEIFSDINYCIRNFALKTCCRGKTKWDVLINVKEAFEEDGEVTFVIWLAWNSVICAFYVQHCSLSTRRCFGNLKDGLSRACVGQ